MSYFDLNTGLTWEDATVRDTVYQFAKEVVRPVTRELDRMTAQQMIASGSPLYDLYAKSYQLGYHKMLFPESLGGPGFTPLQKAIFIEEMAWGSFGFSVGLGVAPMPFYFLLGTGKQELIEEFVVPFLNCTDGSIRGCWGITEPNHGTDAAHVEDPLLSQPGVKGDVRGRIDGDYLVINGQKSAWVSGATVATHAIIHLQVDDSMGLAGSGIAFMPLNLPGISKGAPLEKLGQRDLNQGELFFDDVRIPMSWLLLGPDMYKMAISMVLAHANLNMAISSTGLARAAFDESFKWAKERVQGGKVLIEHDSMKQRLFTMFARVETCRALSRSVANFNFDNPAPATEYSIAAKITATELCYQNAHDAIQIHGGYGLTREYLSEKLFRDARAALIEDGTTETLAKKGGYYLMDTYPRLNKL